MRNYVILKVAARAAVFGFVLASASAALATDGAWVGASGGNWGDTGNWQGGVYPTGTGSTAYFTNGTGVTVWQNLSSLTLGNLAFANADTLITNNTITLNGGGTSVITVAGTGTTANVSVELSGTSGSLVKEGSGTLRLNRYAYGLSGFTINGGLVYCGCAGNSDGLNVGNGTITVNNGTVLKYGGPNQINNYAVIDVKKGGVFDVNGQTDNIGAITGEFAPLARLRLRWRVSRCWRVAPPPHCLLRCP